MCCACGTPSSSPLTWIFTSAVVPVTVIQDAPLPVTRFAVIGSSAAWYDRLWSADAQAAVADAEAPAGPARRTPSTQATAPAPATLVRCIVVSRRSESRYDRDS